MRMGGFRSLSGIAGAAAALAGGIGAAVGQYTAPHIESFHAHGHSAYTAIDQRAIAASTLEPGPFGGTILRISVSRGARNSLGFTIDGNADDGVQEDISGTRSAGVLLEAQIHTCYEFGCEPQQQWRGLAPVDSFEFDPLMNTASFSAEVAGCLFVVSWQGAGEIVPFEGHGAATGGDEDGEFDWDATFFVTGSVFGEVSRTADADIQTSPADEDPSCLTYARTGAPGYLTQGAAAGENTAEGRLN